MVSDSITTMSATEIREGRVARRQRRNREAVLAAARSVMSSRGIDKATISEIADLADVGSGTVYSYFRSKETLAVAVLEVLMRELAERIESETVGFDDPASVYAHGVHTVLTVATTDPHWGQLLARPEVVAEALYDQMGPYAVRDLRTASEAGRLIAPDPELVWRMTTGSIVGISRAILADAVPRQAVPDAVVTLLGMAGMERAVAVDLVTGLSA